MKNLRFFVKFSARIYSLQPDDITELDVHLDKSTVWLTQSQIAKLLGATGHFQTLAEYFRLLEDVSACGDTAGRNVKR